MFIWSCHLFAKILQELLLKYFKNFLWPQYKDQNPQQGFRPCKIQTYLSHGIIPFLTSVPWTHWPFFGFSHMLCFLPILGPSLMLSLLAPYLAVSYSFFVSQFNNYLFTRLFPIAQLSQVSQGTVFFSFTIQITICNNRMGCLCVCVCVCVCDYWVNVYFLNYCITNTSTMPVGT